MLPYVIFNFKNGDAPVDVKSDLASIAKAVSYYGSVKRQDITVTTPTDTLLFDTFGGFLNRVYDSSFPIREYSDISMKYGPGNFPKDIEEALYTVELE